MTQYLVQYVGSYYKDTKRRFYGGTTLGNPMFADNPDYARIYPRKESAQEIRDILAAAGWPTKVVKCPPPVHLADNDPWEPVIL